MESGGYVSDEITNQIVADRLSQPDANDGLPARRLSAYGGAGRHAGRVPGRDRSGPRRRRLPGGRRGRGGGPAAPKRAETQGRADDTEDTIRVRLQVYDEQTAPLIDVYRERGLLVEVDGLGPVDEVTQRLLAALGSRSA